VIAAATGAQVSVSTDEGRTFQAATVDARLTVRRVLVRHDGVLTAVAARAGEPPDSKAAAPRTFLSRDRGKTWQPSPFQPLAITREGAWIWNGERSCPAVLSRDGRRWTRNADPRASLDDRPSFASALWLNDDLFPSEDAPRMTAADPPAPELPAGAAALTGAERPCEKEGAGLSAFGSLLGALGDNLRDCRGARCLLGSLGPEPPPPRTRFQMFDDAACAPAHAAPDHTCRLGAPLSRPPTFAVIDGAAGSVVATPAPPGCASPVAVRSAAGLGVLLCRAGADSTQLFVRDAPGPWRDEGRLPLPPDDLQRLVAAADGTLVLAEQPETDSRGALKRPLRAALRSPRPLGAAGAWRLVTAPEGVAIRPAPGGAALVATSPAASGGRKLDLTLDQPGQPPVAIARGVDVPQNLLEIEVRDGRVRVMAHPTHTPHSVMWSGLRADKKDGLPAPLLLTRGGQLAPEQPPAGAPNPR
jgi:hypothetical protein